MAVFSGTYSWRMGVTGGLLLCSAILAPPIPAQQTPSTEAIDSRTPSPLFKQVIANQEGSEIELDQYERIQREEIRHDGAGTDPRAPETKIWRVFPTGTGVDKIPLSPDGKPPSPESYRTELEKLEKYLSWVIQSGAPQKEAYAKAERKRKERFDLLEATYQAFLFTPNGEETRGGRVLLRYTLRPNPNYRPTSRNTTIFTRVRGIVWIDKESAQLAKIEGTVTEDISLGLFLAKVYKGSHFMQERYEITPGVWQPTFEQYDFDGRKFLRSFSIHERSFYSGYKRVGRPEESIELVRTELNKLRTEAGARSGATS